MPFLIIDFCYRQTYIKNNSYFKVLNMSDGLEYSILVPMSKELKDAIQNEAARRQVTAAELIRAQMHFCLASNIEKSISIITGGIIPEEADGERGTPEGN